MPIGSSKIGVLGGKVIVCGGSQTFNASGTFTVPKGVEVLYVAGKGGAGNAGNAGSNTGGRGAGGSGGSGGNTPSLNNPCGPLNAGSAGGTGRPGVSGTSGNPGNAGCTSTAFSLTFSGGNAGNGGAGTNAGTGRPGNSAVPSTSAGSGKPTSGGGNMQPVAGTPTGKGRGAWGFQQNLPGGEWQVIGGGGGGGATSYSPVNALCTQLYLDSDFNSYGDRRNGGYSGMQTLQPSAVNQTSGRGGTGSFARTYGQPNTGASNPGSPGSLNVSPACTVSRAGGGGGGGAQVNGKIAGSGGGGGDVYFCCSGNPGQAGNPGANANPQTTNCVAVTPEASYPVSVSGAGGQVIVSWNPQ